MNILGIDPDSDKYGVSLYQSRDLISLHSLSICELIKKIQDSPPDLVSIENVMANNFMYGARIKSSRNMETYKKIAIAFKQGLCTGRCQASQKVLMEFLDDMNIPYVLHKPQKGNWAENKTEFERITKWSKRSNKDTRSAAYFGFLEACKGRA